MKIQLKPCVSWIFAGSCFSLPFSVQLDELGSTLGITSQSDIDPFQAVGLLPCPHTKVCATDEPHGVHQRIYPLWSPSSLFSYIFSMCSSVRTSAAFGLFPIPRLFNCFCLLFSNRLVFFFFSKSMSFIMLILHFFSLR